MSAAAPAYVYVVVYNYACLYSSKQPMASIHYHPCSCFQS